MLTAQDLLKTFLFLQCVDVQKSVPGGPRCNPGGLRCISEPPTVHPENLIFVISF
jgi:hypothetical protein